MAPDKVPGFDPSDPVQVAVRITQLEGQIARSQDNFTQTAQDLNRNIEGMRNDVRAAVEEIRTSHSKRDGEWEDWRRTHEADNQKTRDQMVRWNGIAVGVSVLSTALMGTILTIYLGDKAVARENLARVERTQTAEIARLESNLNNRADTNAAAIREIERYLTQEGTVSGRPYVPSRR